MARPLGSKHTELNLDTYDEEHREDCLNCTKAECTNCFLTKRNASYMRGRKARQIRQRQETKMFRYDTAGDVISGDTKNVSRLEVFVDCSSRYHSLQITDKATGISYRVSLRKITKWLKEMNE